MSAGTQTSFCSRLYDAAFPTLEAGEVMMTIFLPPGETVLPENPALHIFVTSFGQKRGHRAALC